MLSSLGDLVNGVSHIAHIARRERHYRDAAIRGHEHTIV